MCESRALTPLHHVDASGRRRRIERFAEPAATSRLQAAGRGPRGPRAGRARRRTPLGVVAADCCRFAAAARDAAEGSLNRLGRRRLEMATVLPIASVARMLAARPSGASRVRSAVRAMPLALAVTLLAASGVLAGNGATTVHFTASYSSFTCAGERIVKTAAEKLHQGLGDLHVHRPDGVPARNLCHRRTGRPGESDPVPLGQRLRHPLHASGESRLRRGPPICFRIAVSGTIVVTDNGDGTGTLVVVAYY